MLAGEFRGHLTHPDGSVTDFIRYLLHGEEWRFTWTVADGTDLDLKVTPKERIRAGAYVRAHIQDEGRVSWALGKSAQDRRGEFEFGSRELGLA